MPSTALSKKDLFVTVTLPILLAAVGLLTAAGAMYARLDDAIDGQRLETKADFKSLSDKMDANTQAMGGLQVELSRMNGEIVKAKGEMIQEISKLGLRQAVLEETGKPLPKN